MNQFFAKRQKASVQHAHQPSGMATGAFALAAVATAGIGGAWVLQQVHVPAPWLVGPLVVAMLWRSFGPATPGVPQWLQRAASALLGANLAENVTPQVLQTLQEALGGALSTVLVLLAASVGTGLLFARLARMDPITGVLSFLPGAASAVVALSRDLRADPRLVSTLQYLRLTIVVLAAPFAASLLASAGLSPDLDGSLPAPDPALSIMGRDTGPEGLLSHALTWGSVLLGLWVGRTLVLPAATLLVPMTLLVTAGALGYPGATISPWFITAAFVVVGMWAGLQFDRPAIVRAGKAALWAVPLVFALILVSGLSALLLSQVSGIPLVTTFLATAPGGLEAMVATSLDLGADAALVLSIQLLRFLVVLVTAPFVAHRLSGASRDRQA